MLNENVSYKNRMERSNGMRNHARRLLQIKKIKSKKLASRTILKKRAAKLARIMLRKRVAGTKGQLYETISIPQKGAINKLIDQMPKNIISELSNKLLPFIIKTEHARLASLRKNENQLKEAHITNRERSYRRAAAERATHKRKAGRGFAQHKFRENPAGLKRRLNRLARLEVLKQMGGKIKRDEDQFVKDAIRDMLIDRPKRLKHVKSRSKHREKNERAGRADFSRLSKRSNLYDVDTEGGQGALYNDFDFDLNFAEYLAEGVDPKLEKLFRRGLVPYNKIEEYKRIFYSVSDNIKLQRYQKDISDLLETLIKMITKNNVIYRRIRLDLQKKRDWKIK